MILKFLSLFGIHASLRLGWTGAVRPEDRTLHATVKRFLTPTSLLGVWLALSVPLAASDFQMTLGNSAVVTISLQLSPDVDNWGKISADTYAGNGYELGFKDKSTAGRSELTVQLQRAAGQPFVF